MKSSVTKIAMTALVVLATSQLAYAWDYNSSLSSYVCRSTGSGTELCAYAASNLQYGQGWNLYSFDYVNGVHFASHTVCPRFDTGTNLYVMDMAGQWAFSGIGVSVSADSGGLGVSIQINESTVGYTQNWNNGMRCNYIQVNFGGPHPKGMLFYRSEKVVSHVQHGQQIWRTEAAVGGYL